MKTICYAKRKRGVHGYLKLIDGNGLPSNDVDSVLGTEIHFRVQSTLSDRFKRALKYDVDYQGKPMFLKIQSRTRELSSLDMRFIKSGEDEYMNTLWSAVMFHAHQLAQQSMQLNGFIQNCHVLSFQALERAELDAPRDNYDKYIRRLSAAQAITHHPS